MCHRAMKMEQKSHQRQRTSHVYVGVLSVPRISALIQALGKVLCYYSGPFQQDTAAPFLTALIVQDWKQDKSLIYRGLVTLTSSGLQIPCLERPGQFDRMILTQN